jgi:hypothetical protein
LAAVVTVVVCGFCADSARPGTKVLGKVIDRNGTYVWKPHKGPERTLKDRWEGRDERLRARAVQEVDTSDEADVTADDVDEDDWQPPRIPRSGLGHPVYFQPACRRHGTFMVSSQELIDAAAKNSRAGKPELHKLYGWMIR